MSKRLIPTRKRRNTEDVVDSVIDSPEYFDFDFRINQTSIPPSGPSTNSGRPRTSGRDGLECRKETSLQPRPRSSSGTLFSGVRRMSPTEAGDSRIGLALGSPTHPPSGWTNISERMFIDQSIQQTMLGPSRTPSKWKRMGDKLRTKPVMIAPPAHHTNYQNASSNRRQNDEMLHDNHIASPQPSSLRSQANSGLESPRRKPIVKVNQVHEMSTTKPTSTLEIFPRLDVEIPSIQMDRYSIMFQGINGIASSNLLARRSKVTTDLKALQLKEKQDLPPLPLTPRRVTSPNATKPAYSLFPSAPGVRSESGNSPNPDSMLRQSYQRPMSSPARLSPYQESFKMNRINIPTNLDSQKDRKDTPIPLTSTSKDVPRQAESEPHKKRAEPVNLVTSLAVHKDVAVTLSDQEVPHTAPEIPALSLPSKEMLETSDTTAQPLGLRTSPSSDIVSSPDDNTPLRNGDHTPWSSRESIESLASSNSSVDDAIFFGIKSCDDLTDQTKAEFIISRPDSTAVQLARTMSRKIKHDQLYQAAQNEVPKIGPVITAMPPDLQAAEHCQLDSRSSSCDNLVRLSMFDEAIAEVERLASPSASRVTHAEPAFDKQMIRLQKKAPNAQLNIPTQFRGLAIGIPSPIMERSEEGTPMSDQRQSMSPNPRHIVHQASPRLTLSSPSFVSSTLDVPPPVPEKDCKYLPVSKYTAQHESTRTPTEPSPRPQLPVRSFTEPCTYSVPHTTPCTPVNQATFSARAAADYGAVLPADLKVTEKSIVAVAVEPVSEVSVARTISLRRKPSQQVLVSRSSSKKGDRPTLIDAGETLHLSLETRARSPIVHMASSLHRPGKSMNLVLETA